MAAHVLVGHWGPPHAHHAHVLHPWYCCANSYDRLGLRIRPLQIQRRAKNKISVRRQIWRHVPSRRDRPKKGQSGVEEISPRKAVLINARLQTLYRKITHLLELVVQQQLLDSNDSNNTQT